MRRKLRDFFRRLPALPVLTAMEKTALAAVVAVLAAGAALRAWERSGVKLGPVEDWETLRELVVRARAEQGNPAYACAEDAPPERFARIGREREILAAGAAAAPKSAERPPSAGGGKKTAPALPIDLNAAEEKALLALPGVGPSTAKAILAHRAARGDFRSVDELLQVKGIGPRKLEAIRPFVTVGTKDVDMGR